MKRNGLTDESVGGASVLRFPSVGTRERNRVREGLCIPCAVADDEFKERAPVCGTAPLGEEETRAWIRGRSFELLRHPAATVICIRCGQEVSAAYAPEEQRIA